MDYLDKGGQEEMGRHKSQEALMRMSETLADCGRADCHACRDGKCIALYDNDFHGRTCPFFKTSQQVKKENEATIRRLIRDERYDLLERYSSVLKRYGLYVITDEDLDAIADMLDGFAGDDLDEQLLGLDDSDEDDWEDDDE